MLNDTPAVAVNPKAAAEASATNIKPTYVMGKHTVLMLIRGTQHWVINRNT